MLLMLGCDGVWVCRMTGRKLRVMNFGSYNYLGFAENKELCATAVQEVMEKYGIGNAASRQELGQYSRPTAQCADTTSLTAQCADTTSLSTVCLSLIHI